MARKDKILIVDDEQINVDFFEVMLSKLGFEVEKAEDGQEALLKIQNSAPDLIILDNLMPTMSGWDLARLLKQDDQYKQFRTIPIIMLSAMDEIKDKIEGYEIGVEDYITKPFNFSEVLSRIRGVLREQELSQQIRKRESRLAVIENLNKSLIYFAGHVYNPVSEILKACHKLNVKNPAEVNIFISQVVQESETILATIEALKEEIKSLKNQEDQLRETEISLESLEAKYQKHFKLLREKEKGTGGK